MMRQVENKLRKRESGTEETGVERYVARGCISVAQQSYESMCGYNPKK